MSNPYYTFTPRFVPGTKVRAGAVNAQFDLLEDAFDALPTSSSAIVLGTATLGVESGSGNAYVVTMPNTRTANASGDEVVFKATHQNSGASTLQVDSVPAVALVRWDGTVLSSGDILVDSYYVARYDSTNTQFKIVAPAQSTIVGALTYATPSGKAKLAASAGVASTVIRSDADIAIDQTIAPTWSGVHTFTPAAVFTGGFTSTASATFTNGFTSAGQALNQNGTALLPAYSFSGDPNTGTYNVAADDWGVATGGTLRFDISTTAITSTLPNLGAAGSNAAPTYSFSGDPNTGAYSVGADDWGVATGGTLRFDISTTLITSTLPNVGPAGSNTAPTWSFSGDPNTGAYSVGADDWGVATGGTLRFDISTTAITSTLPWRGQNGTAGAPAFSFSGDADNGVYLDSANSVSLSTGGTSHITVRDNGSPFIDINKGPLRVGDGAVGTPALTFFNDPNTGIYRIGADDFGFAANGVLMMEINRTTNQISLNAPALYSDGSAGTPPITFTNDPDTGFYRDTANQIAVALGGATAGQIAQGSFTGTLTGMTGSVTGTVNYQRIGNHVFLWINSAITGTSNASTMTMTGLPAIVTPATAVRASGLVQGFTDNGGGTKIGGTTASTSGILTFTLVSGSPLDITGFTSSGTKGLSAGWQAVYSVQ